MKNIFTILLLIISLYGFSQNLSKSERKSILDAKKSGIKKEVLSDTIQNKDCKNTSTYDKFKKTTRVRNTIDVFQGIRSLRLEFGKIITEKHQYYSITTYSAPGCITSRSYLAFIIKGDDVITLKYEGDIDCNAVIAPFLISEINLKKLMNSKITDVRIMYDYKFDLEVNEKNDLKIKSSIYCILNSSNELNK
jgi:hypothetical protein